jgi:hypothetical protein
MKITILSLRYAVPAAVLTILTTSCATPALWKCTAAREWKPYRPDQVILVTDTNQQREVVVVFTQFANSESTSDSRDVGWRVSQPPKEVALTKETIGLLTNSLCQSKLVPMLFDGQESPDEYSLASGYTVWNSPNQQLTIHIPGLPSGPYTLPTSHQKRRTALRVFLLPLAVTADAAIVGVLSLGYGVH